MCTATGTWTTSLGPGSKLQTIPGQPSRSIWCRHRVPHDVTTVWLTMVRGVPLSTGLTPTCGNTLAHSTRPGPQSHGEHRTLPQAQCGRRQLPTKLQMCVRNCTLVTSRPPHLRESAAGVQLQAKVRPRRHKQNTMSPSPKRPTRMRPRARARSGTTTQLHAVAGRCPGTSLDACMHGPGELLAHATAAVPRVPTDRKQNQNWCRFYWFKQTTDVRWQAVP